MNEEKAEFKLCDPKTGELHDPVTLTTFLCSNCNMKIILFEYPVYCRNCGWMYVQEQRTGEQPV